MSLCGAVERLLWKKWRILKSVFLGQRKVAGKASAINVRQTRVFPCPVTFPQSSHSTASSPLRQAALSSELSLQLTIQRSCPPWNRGCFTAWKSEGLVSARWGTGCGPLRWTHKSGCWEHRSPSWNRQKGGARLRPLQCA